MKSLLLISLVLLFTNPALANDNHGHSEGMKWNIDAVHSAVNFTIRHFFTPVPGHFSEYEGEIYFNPEDLGNSSVDVTIQVASVDTRNARRDAHLQNEDFFEVERWPTMRFVSDRITQDGENSFIAHGSLTIRDVTKEIELPFQFLGMMEHPMRENTLVAGIKSEYSLLRNDFGVGTGSWAETGVVGNTVNIEILLELLHSPS